jgi:hypothetical protein
MIKLFDNFINEQYELDPYGEENLDDNVKVRIAKCKKDFKIGRDKVVLFHKGDEYEIVDDHDWDGFMILKTQIHGTPHNHAIPLNNMYKDSFWKHFIIKENIKSDVDPYGEENWNDLEPVDDVVLRFRNYYKCVECGNEWEDEWDSTCDDECPNCGTIMTPYESEDINESFTEDDPYGEEIWNDIKPDPINRDTEIEIGDKIYYHYDRNNIEPAFMGEVERIINHPKFGFVDYLISGKYSREISKMNLIGCGARIIKRTNETINIDPYNEENWKDEEEFNIGDELICKEDIMTSTGKYWLFHQGKTYSIIRVTHDWIFVLTKSLGHEVNIPFTRKGIWKSFDKKN